MAFVFFFFVSTSISSLLWKLSICIDCCFSIDVNWHRSVLRMFVLSNSIVYRSNK